MVQLFDLTAVGLYYLNISFVKQRNDWLYLADAAGFSLFCSATKLNKPAETLIAGCRQQTMNCTV